MRVIARRTLREFWQKHPGATGALQSWYREASQANWDGPAAVKRRYRHASFLAGNRIVFNIGENKFRLVVQANYDCKVLSVRFIGACSEFDRINPESI